MTKKGRAKQMGVERSSVARVGLGFHTKAGRKSDYLPADLRNTYSRCVSLASAEQLLAGLREMSVG